MPRRLALGALAVLLSSAASAQTPQTLPVPADSSRWDLVQQARAAEHRGRKCLLLDGRYDALGRNLERPLTAAEIDGIRWQDVAEPGSPTPSSPRRPR